MRTAAVILALTATAAAQPGEIQKPDSRPRGKPVRLRLALDPETVHRARIEIEQQQTLPDGKLETVLELVTRVLVTQADETGARVQAPVEVRKLTVNGKDLTAAARGARPAVRARRDRRGLGGAG
ncbi:MAG: hypothetical protein ACE5JG_06480, partial [Planctomycetota bacterium]